MSIINTDGTEDLFFQGEVYRVHPDAKKYAGTGLFRHLDDQEERKFIKWAKEQPQGVKVQPIWHPVVQNELLLSGRGEV